jgi:membrane associated rhomboid family serine protease
MHVLIALVVLNVIVSLFGFRALHGHGRADAFLFVPHDVAIGKNGLGWLLSHFAHAGAVHLAFNMLALYSFAGTVLDATSPRQLLLIYVVAGLGSDLVIFALRKDDPAYRCLGASGSVFGVMMAAVVLDPTTSIQFMLVPAPIPGPVFMLGYAAISVVLIAQKRRGGISHEVHPCGAIFGLALTAVLAPRGLEPLLRWFAQWL